MRSIRGQISDQAYGSLYAMDLSADNKHLAVGGWMARESGDDGFIRIIDFQTGEIIKAFSCADSIASLTFSPDGAFLASGTSSGTLELWNLRKMAREPLTNFPQQTKHIYALGFSPDGRRLVSGSTDGKLHMYSLEYGEHVKVKLPKVLVDGPTPIKSIAFSPDNRFLATGEGGTILLWDGKTGRFIKKLATHHNRVRGLSFSAKGNLLLVGSDSGDVTYSSQVFSVPQGRKIASFHDNGSFVLTTDISPNDQLAVTAGGANFEIYLWELRSGKQKLKLAGSGRRVESVGFAPDGRSVVFGPSGSTTSDTYVEQTFNLQQDEEYRLSLGGVASGSDYLRAFEKHGDYEISVEQTGADYEYGVLNVFKGQERQSQIVRGLSSGFQHLSYTLTRDGSQIVSGGDNGELALFDANSGSLVHKFSQNGHNNSVTSVAISLDNKTLVSGSSDQTVKLWDLKTGMNLLTIFVAIDQEWVAWTPQGYYTSSLNGDKYIGWHRNNGPGKSADFYTAEQFHKDFYRPDVVAEYLKERDIEVAVRNANQKRTESPSSQGVLDATTVSSSLPPVIKIDSPKEDESTVEQEYLLVKATVTSKTIPITSVRVFLNGILISSLETNSHECEVSTGIKLRPNENTLLIDASNRMAHSTPEIRTIFFSAGNRRIAAENLKSVRLDHHSAFSSPYRIAGGRGGSSLQEGYYRKPLSFDTVGRKTPANSYPPQVVIVDPETDSITVNDASLNAVATVTSTDSPLTKVTMLVNGEEQSSTVPGSKKLIAKFTAYLKPGDNEVKIIASDETSTSEPEIRKVLYQPQSTSGNLDLIFLGVGVNKTKNPAVEPLAFAERDVTRVAELLEKQGEGRLFNKVISRVIPSSTNPESNKKAITEGLDWLKAQAKQHPNNLHIIYLAGHGAFDNDSDRNYYLFSSEHESHPQETNDIPWESIMSRFKDLLSHGRGLLFIDTCHAGSSSNLLAVINQYGLKQTNIGLFLASDEQGVSRESADWEGGHGAFTAALIRGLKGEADKDPQDDQVSVRELDDFIKKVVPTEFDSRQRPKAYFVSGSGLEDVTLSKVGRQTTRGANR